MTSAKVSVVHRRFVYDHLAKTAGQWINKLIADQLGPAVTGNLVGDHQDLLGTYGWASSLVSGHLFFNGEGLHPAWTYVTLLRDPLERALSWISYLAHDVLPTNPTHLAAVDAAAFLSDDTAEAELTLGTVRDYYIRHFAGVRVPFTELDRDKLPEIAEQVLREYDLVGIYENLPDFTSKLGKMLGISISDQAEPVNTTSEKLGIQDLSPKRRKHLREATKADRQMYHVAQQLSEKPSKKMAAARHSFSTPIDHNRASLNVVAMSAELRMVDQGECALVVSAEVNVPKAIEGFDARLTLRNSSGITTLVSTLSSSAVFDRNLQPGSCILRWGCVAFLAPGTYRGTLSFFSVSGSQLRGHGVYQQGLEDLVVAQLPDAGTKTPGVVTHAELQRV